MAKQAAKRPKKRPVQKKLALVAGFDDIPDANAILAHFEVPAAYAKSGFYCVRKGQAAWLFDTHPEKKVPSKVAGAGFELMRAVMETERVTKVLGATADMGFHTGLDRNALAKAFEKEGFTVEPLPLSRPSIASSDPRSVESKADLQRLKLQYTSDKLDLVTCALPFVARLWKPKKAKTKPRGLPPELTTLLGAFDGIPTLGVMSAKDIGVRHQYLLRLSKGAKGVGKRDWGTTPKEVRIDRFWRQGWIPFCQRANEETIAIDLEPSAQGKQGQIIGVHLNPPRLVRYRSTLGEWLWNEIDAAWN